MARTYEGSLVYHAAQKREGESERETAFQVLGEFVVKQIYYNWQDYNSMTHQYQFILE